MSNLVTLTIDGKEYQAKEGEFILNVARGNGVFIPAICYLNRCSPTLACRLCLVEADGKQVYACNAKVKEGMNISTITENIAVERRAIMEVYDVNHPLQCGVCDQSGECELQNYSLYMEVDSQSYAIKDVNRPTQNWGVMNYDPGLCIVCEKCVTVCKDMIGSNALGTVKRGGEDLDKDYKASMPKDAYSMWNKLNKSLIGFEADKCTDCGECIAVCPVGALVSTDFKYKSNAWELTKIPAANPHSSDCSLMYYEVKHDSIENNQQNKIYRVTNDSHYASLNGAARFGYDFENVVHSKDEVAFAKAIDAFKKADTIIFNSYITNEEALMLQTLKEAYGYKLINQEAKAYQRFLNTYAQTSGESLYSGSMSEIHSANLVVSLGSYLKSDAPNVRYAFNNAVSMNKGAGLYFHPLEDKTVEGFGKKGKTIETIYHKPMKEEGVLWLLLDLFGDKDAMPSHIKAFIDSYHVIKQKEVVENIKEEIEECVVDEATGEEKIVKKQIPKKITTVVEYAYSTLMDYIGSNEATYETIKEMSKDKDKRVLIIGEDCITHPNAENIATLSALVGKYCGMQIVIIPGQTNTLGVSLICDLDESIGNYSIGYNESGDFTLSALGGGDLDMPALNQQEGTFTNIDKRVVPTNAALAYGGYELNDIMNALGYYTRYTIDYTAKLPEQKGYTNKKFDDLPNYYSNSGEEIRGYLLSSLKCESSVSVQCSLDGYEDTFNVYLANPINQFNEFTAKCHELATQTYFYVSNDVALEMGLDNDSTITLANGSASLQLAVKIDQQLGGKIGYIPYFDSKIGSKKLFNGYRFSSINLTKV